MYGLYTGIGRATAQAVIVGFLTWRPQPGICGGQSGNAAGFLRLPGLVLPLIPLDDLRSSFIIRMCYNRKYCARRIKWT
jgi:hypothetical protein